MAKRRQSRPYGALPISPNMLLGVLLLGGGAVAYAMTRKKPVLGSPMDNNEAAAAAPTTGSSPSTFTSQQARLAFMQPYVAAQTAAASTANPNAIGMTLADGTQLTNASLAALGTQGVDELKALIAAGFPPGYIAARLLNTKMS